MPDIFRSDINNQIGASLRSSRVGTQQYSWNRQILEISTIPAEEGLSIGRGIVVSIRDITASVEANAQLNQAKRLEAIGTLAGGMAHDFNNILQIIYGYIDLIKVTANREEEKYLQDMEEAADKGSSLIQQLLTFGRKKHHGEEPVFS